MTFTINFNETFINNSKAPVKREFEESSELEALANEIIRTDMIIIHPAKVAYLMVTPNISKTIPAKIIKATPEMNFFSQYDYVIEVSSDLWAVLDNELRRILLHDQLLRILPIMNEKKGEYQFKLRNPDYVAFKRIIDLYGTDWKGKVKLYLSSMHGLTPAQEDTIKI